MCVANGTSQLASIRVCRYRCDLYTVLNMFTYERAKSIVRARIHTGVASEGPTPAKRGARAQRLINTDRPFRQLCRLIDINSVCVGKPSSQSVVYDVTIVDIDVDKPYRTYAYSYTYYYST